MKIRSYQFPCFYLNFLQKVNHQKTNADDYLVLLRKSMFPTIGNDIFLFFARVKAISLIDN